MKRVVFAVLSIALALSLSAEPKAPKWLVLDNMTYQAGVDRTAFEEHVDKPLTIC